MKTPIPLSKTLIRIKDKEFILIAKLVYERFGIVLTDSKKALVEFRLGGMLKKSGFKDFISFYQHIIEDKTETSLSLLIDKISTNHSFFFRESYHFDYLVKNIFPDFVTKYKEKNQKIFRIWSAGCATGDESYTIAMLAKEFFSIKYPEIEIKILGTDVSLSALTAADKGVYPDIKIQELPDYLQKKYFTLIKRNTVSISPCVKKNVTFKKMNFIREEYPFKEKFDIIFCRNVMIYFDIGLRKNIIEKMYEALTDKGYFIISHSETLPDAVKNKFQSRHSAIYIKR